MNKIFSLQEVTQKQVILKVEADSPLTVAQYPYISMDWAYITVTRGHKHILTVVKKDGTTFSFDWGDGGHTLISENLERLKKEVCEYIRDDCHILLELDAPKVNSVTIYYNDYFHAWQIEANQASPYISSVTHLDKDIAMVDAERATKETEKFFMGSIIGWRSTPGNRVGTIWMAVPSDTGFRFK